VHLCHSSVREFLFDAKTFDERIPDDFHFDVRKAHCEVAIVCLQYLEYFANLDHSDDKCDRQATLVDPYTRRIWNASYRLQGRRVSFLEAHLLLPYAFWFTLFHVAYFDVPVWELVLQRTAWKRHGKPVRSRNPSFPRLFVNDVSGDGFDVFFVTKPKGGSSTFRFAITNGSLKLAPCLLDRSGSLANPKLLLDQKATFLKETPLMVACGRRKIAMVQYLLDQGAPTELGDQQGRTALTSACERGHADVVKPLIDGKANVNGQSHFRHKQYMLRDLSYGSAQNACFGKGYAAALGKVGMRNQEVRGFLRGIFRRISHSPIHAAVISGK
jgi:hypothetical protein